MKEYCVMLIITQLNERMLCYAIIKQSEYCVMLIIKQLNGRILCYANN